MGRGVDCSSSPSASMPLLIRDKHSPLKHKKARKDSGLETGHTYLQLQSIDRWVTFPWAYPSDALSNSTDLIRSLSDGKRHFPLSLLKRNRSKNIGLLICSYWLFF